MKKIFLILVLLGFIAPSYAFLVESTTSDVDVLKHSNYSESTLKIIDTIKTENTYGFNPYSPAYQPIYPVTAWDHTRMWYEKIKDWVDPMQDDGYFGHHEINFENRFFQNEPSQSMFKKDLKPNVYKVNPQVL